MRFRGKHVRLKSGLALAGAVALAMPALSKGQQIVQYNFANGDATGVTLATMETPTSTATNTTAGSLVLGSKTDTALDEGSAAAAYWASPSPDYLSVSRDTTAGLDDTNFYLDFTVTTSTGYVMDPTGVTIVGGQGGGTANTRSFYLFDSNDGLPSGGGAVTGTGAPYATVTSGTLVGEGEFSVVRNTGAAMNSPTIAFPTTDQNLYSFDVRVYFDTPTVSQNIDLASITLNGSVVAAPLQQTWNSSTSGDYNLRTNWNDGTPPNAIGAEADFLGAITSNQVVYSTAPMTLGKIVFDNSVASYALTGAVGANLTLQTSSGSAVVDVQAGTHEINLPLTLASNTTFQTDVSNANLIIANPMTINSGIALTTTGSGTVTYDSNVTLLSGATMSIASSTDVHDLTINATAAVSLAPTSSTKTVLQVGSLSLANSSGAWTSKLDLTNNAMILTGGGATGLANITSQLKEGFNNGTWNGAGGITSSTAAADTRHLTTLGSRLSAGGVFDGVNTTTSDVLVKYTYYGDANLDGSVNGADYQQIDAGFGMHLTGWQNGDFNYDGVVDGSDFSLIDNTFNQINATGAAPLALNAGPAAALQDSVSAVPEPIGLSLLGMGALALIPRRNRKST